MSVISIKNQLGFISLLFLVFVALVLFQIFYAHKMLSDEIVQLQTSYKMINDFLVLEEQESSMLTDIRAVADGTNTKVTPETLQELEDSVGKWRDSLISWEADISRWKMPGGTLNQNSVFDKSFITNKKRQGESYRKAVTLCRQQKMKDVNYMLNIENRFQPSVHKTTISILDGIKAKIESDNLTVQRFYIFTAIAVLLALVLLIMVSFGIFRNITGSLRVMEQGARRISSGDFSIPIEISSPHELYNLAASFNEMQEAIKLRDEKIHEDANEIRKLNEVLEQKVVERNRTILQQNTALTRKNEELEQILYAASHDLRTPLISIQGFSEELKVSCATLKEEVARKEVNSSAVREIIDNDLTLFLNYIISGSKRMELLLEGLLRLSRMGRESLQIQKVNMNELMQNVTAGLGFQINEAKAEVSVGKLDDCSADPAQFEQVFSNFIGNAIKYRDSSRPCRINIYSEKDKDVVRYFVKDNGIGIPEEYHDRIFHAFFRVDDEKVAGDGIGLAVVNRALDLHDGRAWVVESKPGEGSTFGIEIPDRLF